MPHVSARKELRFSEIIQSGYCLAPSRYAEKGLVKSVTYRDLHNVIVEGTEREKIVPSATYDYVEISDIDVSLGTVSPNTMFGIYVPSMSPVSIKDRDILLSTVRTYRNGIAMASLDGSRNTVCSPAIMVIRGTSSEYNREWLFGFLRSKYFLDQVHSLQNRGLYPRLDRDAAKHIAVPTPTANELAYASTLVDAFLRLRDAMVRRDAQIHSLIERELRNVSSSYVHTPPTFTAYQKWNRIDAGFYGEDVRRILHSLFAYRHGSKSVENFGFKILRGQNLQRSAIGESIHSDIPRADFYRVIRPRTFSELGTVGSLQYLGNANQLSTLESGDVVFSGEGNVGKSIVVDAALSGSITNIHGIVLRPDAGQNHVRSCFLAAVLRYLRRRGVFDALSVGGQGGSFATQYWNLIEIPQMPFELQATISKSYSFAGLETPAAPDNKSARFRALVEAAEAGAGIIQLDRLSRSIWAEVETLISATASGRTHPCSYDFISSGSLLGVDISAETGC